LTPGISDITDGLVLIGMLAFPAYSLYWFPYQLRSERRQRLRIGIWAFLAWCLATYVCFVRLMLGCIGGHCAGRVSPFLEFAVVYALVTVGLIWWMHRSRAARRAP
jgi:hypothetical protein